MDMTETRVLVTGGAGFIGSHLVDGLLDAGARVRVLDDLSTGRLENLEPIAGRLEFHEGSVTEPADCARAVEGMELVYHLAAIPSVQRSVADPRPTHLVGATGTLNVLHAATEAGVRRVVYAGSSSAYGDTPTLPKHEDLPARPRSPYAVAKLAGEHYARVFPTLFGLETVVLRYFNVFGPRQDPDSPYSAAIPRFIEAALRGEAPTINGDGGQTRDFTYVANVVSANLLAGRAVARGVVGEVFNVGSGARVSVLDLWATIRDLLGVLVDAEHAPARPGDVRDSLADLSRIGERLGYLPAVDLREGLARTIRWLSDRPGGVADVVLDAREGEVS